MADVELVYDPECPNVRCARSNLLQAFARARIPAKWREWDRSAPSSPAYVRRFGSPTILINGMDAVQDTGCRPDESAADHCRLYGAEGAPSIEDLSRALSSAHGARQAGVLGALATGPGVGTLVLAKLACPFCYPALGALVSALGLGFLFDGRALIVLSGVFSCAALFGLGYRARLRRGYTPFGVGVFAVVLAWLGKWQNWEEAFYLGVTGLIVASIWNLLPKRACEACAGTRGKARIKPADSK